MKTSSVTTALDSRLEEEPPGRRLAKSELEDKPPSISATNRYRFFGHIPDRTWNDWRWHFQNRITTVDELKKFIPLSFEEEQQLRSVAAQYPLAITPHYLSLIDPDDPHDAIRRQSVPCIQEITESSVGVEDPLEEKGHTVVPGLVHRYYDRVLMVLTDICPMLCRHCTRKREWVNGGWVRTPAEVQAMLDYIRQHKEVRDVIISGGDPLTLSNRRLEETIAGIRRISHVEIIRIGTRFPVVLPQRIDADLCHMLSQYGPIWLNTHFNHYSEITPESAAAVDRLLRAGVPVNNQSVLLRGVNDDVATMTKLCQGLLRIKARPYYLFQCDEVKGTDHLRTSIETGIKIIEGLRGRTSGLAIPTFVVDLPHGGGKVPVLPQYVLSHNERELVLRNPEGRIFRYRNPGQPAHAELIMDPAVEKILAGSGLEF